MKILLWSADPIIRGTGAAALQDAQLAVSNQLPAPAAFDAETLGIGIYPDPDAVRPDGPQLAAIQAHALGIVILTGAAWQLMSESWACAENRIYLSEPVPAEMLPELIHRAAYSFHQLHQNEAFANLFFLIWSVKIQTDYADWSRVFGGILSSIAAGYGGLRALLLMAEHGDTPPQVLASEGFPLDTEALSGSLAAWGSYDDPAQGPALIEQWVRGLYRSMHYEYIEPTALYFPVVFRKRIEGYLFIECHYTENVADLGRMITHFVSDLIRIYYLESQLSLTRSSP